MADRTVAPGLTSTWQVLPILRALHKIYGPISVIHFDAHLVSKTFASFFCKTHNGQDTWAGYAGQFSEQSRVTHGTFFYLAQEEGLMSNQSIHAGIRCKLNVSDCVSENLAVL